MKKIIALFCFSVLGLSTIVSASSNIEKAEKTDLLGVDSKILKKEEKEYKEKIEKQQISSKSSSLRGWKVYKDREGRISSKSFYNNSGYITYTEYYVYYDNRTVINKTFNNSVGKRQYSHRIEKDLRNRIVKRFKINYYYARVYEDGRAYFSNNKLKMRIVYNYKGNGSRPKKTKASLTYWRSNGTKKKNISAGYRQNKYNMQSTTYTYLFNKKGQLKSNKHGKAYRYKVTLKKDSTIIKGVYRAKYSKKGKRGKNVKVKPTKSNTTMIIRIYL